jgi:mannose/fructose/N-acetylgalactosamine-specific phosphotransferase system component IIC
MTELLLLSALLALLEMDTTYIGQFLFSRPLAVGGALGFLTGDFLLGLQLGLFTELLYLDFIPIGGVVPPSGAISAGMSVLAVYFFGIPVYFAFFAGIICGVIFSFIEKRIRRWRVVVLHDAEKEIIAGRLCAARLIAESLVLQYLSVFAFVLVMLTAAGPLMAFISLGLPEKVHIAFKFSYFIAPWMGLAVLFLSFSAKPETD